MTLPSQARTFCRFVLETLPQILTAVNQKLQLNMWKNTRAVTDWFSNLKRKQQCTFFCFDIVDFYYRKRGSASYIVREVREVREREIQRERARNGSDVTLVALKLEKSFALFLATNLHLSFSPMKKGAEFTLSVAKTLHYSKQFAFFVKFALFAIVLSRSNGVGGDRSTEKRSNFQLHRPSSH